MLSPLNDLSLAISKSHAPDLSAEVAELISSHFHTVTTILPSGGPGINAAQSMAMGVEMLLDRYRRGHAPSAVLTDMISHADRAVHHLFDRTISSFPLSHHFAILAARTLIDGVGFKRTRQDARLGLDRLVTGLEGGLVLRHSQWKSTVLKACKTKLESLGGLQHLANAAVGATEGEAELSEQGIDLASILTDGYLACLA